MKTNSGRKRPLFNILCCCLAAWMMAGVSGTAFAQCDGTGDAALLIKGRCAPGEPLKFRLAGPPYAKFRIYCADGPGPSLQEGIGMLCLDDDSSFIVVAEGRLNRFGFGAAFSQVPEDLEGVGTSLYFQAAIKSLSQSNKVAISNTIEFPICSGCYPLGENPGKVKRFSVIGFVDDAGAYPKSVKVRATPLIAPDELLGELEIVLDRDARPRFPQTSSEGGLTITDLTLVSKRLIVHAEIDGTHFDDDGCVPSNIKLEIIVGDTKVENTLHTSDRLPMEVGQWLSPFAITAVERLHGRKKR